MMLSSEKDLIEGFRGEHSHPPNPLRVKAMLEEREVMEQMMNSAEKVKPRQLLSTVRMYRVMYTVSVQYVFYSVGKLAWIIPDPDPAHVI